MKFFNLYCLNQHNFIAQQAISQAIQAANDHFPDAGLCLPPTIPPANSWLSLETANPKFRGKFSLILNEVENRSGARYPIAVVHCFKEGGLSFTANPAWELFQGDSLSQATTTHATPPTDDEPEKKISIVLVCPTCRQEHRGPHATCYYCHVHSQYERAKVSGHPYLERKQIPPHVAQSLDWRVFGGKLIIPLEGTTGYQVINPHGEKRYAVQHGLQQAHVTIGELCLELVW